MAVSWWSAFYILQSWRPFLESNSLFRFKSLTSTRRELAKIVATWKLWKKICINYLLLLRFLSTSLLEFCECLSDICPEISFQTSAKESLYLEIETKNEMLPVLTIWHWIQIHSDWIKTIEPMTCSLLFLDLWLIC